MMMVRILFFLMVIVLAACTEPVDREQQARQAAADTVTAAYNYLLNGQYEQFLAYRATTDSMPQTYCSQMLTAYKQFMAQQQQAHQGICSFAVSDVQRDSTLGVMQVFLQLSYGDSTQERIVVPVVEQGSEWRLK